jgi:hypothetical protein
MSDLFINALTNDNLRALAATRRQIGDPFDSAGTTHVIGPIYNIGASKKMG